MYITQHIPVTYDVTTPPKRYTSDVSPLSFANLTYSRPSSFVISPAVAESDSATAAPPLIPRDSAHFDRDAILALLRLAFKETDDRENA